MPGGGLFDPGGMHFRPPPVAVPESSSPSPSLPPAPTCEQVSDAVADDYLVDWSLTPNSITDDDKTFASCRIGGELRLAHGTHAHLIIFAGRADGSPTNGTSPNEEAEESAKASMEGPCIPATPREVNGPYYFAATCSRMATRPARFVTALVDDGNEVQVSAVIDRTTDDRDMQRVLKDASMGAAVAVLRLM